MAEYLARLKSVRSRIPSTCTASVNSYPNQALPDKHLDKLTGTPIIAPLDTVDQVSASLDRKCGECYFSTAGIFMGIWH